MMLDGNSHEYESLFVRQLERLRLQKDVSQREMSLSLGQAEGYVAKLTNPNDRHLPRMMNFFWICDYLNIHPKDFFNEGIEYPQIVQSISNDLCKLNENQLKYLAALVGDLAKDR